MKLTLLTIATAIAFGLAFHTSPIVIDVNQECASETLTGTSINSGFAIMHAHEQVLAACSR